MNSQTQATAEWFYIKASFYRNQCHPVT